MSKNSQEYTKNRLTELMDGTILPLSADTRLFQHLARTFLCELGKHLGLREVKLLSCEDCCSLCGLWEDGGIYIRLSLHSEAEKTLLYRRVRGLHDHKGDHDRYFSAKKLRALPYRRLIGALYALRKDCDDGYAA